MVGEVHPLYIVRTNADEYELCTLDTKRLQQGELLGGSLAAHNLADNRVDPDAIGHIYSLLKRRLPTTLNRFLQGIPYSENRNITLATGDDVSDSPP